MGSAVAHVEVESLTSELARARKIAHAFVRRRLRLQGERVFEVAESAYAKYEDLRFVEQRDPGLSWLFTVLRRDAARLESERRRFVAFDELRLVSRELEPPDELEAEDARFAEGRTRFAEIREELEGTLTQDYVRLLAYILGGARSGARLGSAGSLRVGFDRGCGGSNEMRERFFGGGPALLLPRSGSGFVIRLVRVPV